jgi:hypothetical protein
MVKWRIDRCRSIEASNSVVASFVKWHPLGGPSRWSCCPRLLLLLLGSKFLVMSSTGQTLLMLFTLRVSRQVVGLVAVQRETQLAFVTAQVIAHQVRILGQINRFERQLLETFFTFAFRLGGRTDSTTTKLGTHAILSIHGGFVIVLLLLVLLRDALIYRRYGCRSCE